MARLRHTTGLRSTNPMYGVFRAVKPRIGNRCTASGDLCIRISGINRVLFSYCFRQFLRFRSDTHCFDCWRLARDFTVTASLTVYNGNFNAIRHEGSKVARNCMDASAIFIINTRNFNPNFSRCRNRIFDFDIPALDLTSFEWTYVLPYTRINFPFILPSICLKDMGKTKLIREATCEGHISCRLRVLTIRKRGMYSQYSRRNLGSIITYDFSSCFFPKFKVMHFQIGDIKLHTVVLLFLRFVKILTKLICRWSWSRRSTVNNCRVREFQIPDRRAQ